MSWERLYSWELKLEEVWRRYRLFHFSPSAIWWEYSNKSLLLPLFCLIKSHRTDNGEHMEIKSLPPMDQLSTRLKVIDSSKYQRILALRDLFSSSSILSAMPVNQDVTPASKAAIQLCWWWWFVIRSSRYLYSLLQYIISSIPMNQSKSKYQGTGSTSFTCYGLQWRVVWCKDHLQWLFLTLLCPRRVESSPSAEFTVTERTFKFILLYLCKLLLPS